MKKILPFIVLLSCLGLVVSIAGFLWDYPYILCFEIFASSLTCTIVFLSLNSIKNEKMFLPLLVLGISIALLSLYGILFNADLLRNGWTYLSSGMIVILLIAIQQHFRTRINFFSKIARFSLLFGGIFLIASLQLNNALESVYLINFLLFVITSLSWIISLFTPEKSR